MTRHQAKRHALTHALTLTTLSAVMLVALGLPQNARAAAFQLPVTNAAGYGRSFAGGSLWQNDPSSAYANPAAMAWLTGPVAQGSWVGIDIDTQFHGSVSDPFGREMPGGTPNGGKRLINEGSAFYARPVSDRFAIGFGLEVPYGLLTKYNSSWRGGQFGTMTSLKSIGISLSGSYKVSDSFSLGFGVVAQRTRAQLNNSIDVGSTAALALNGSTSVVNSQGNSAFPFDPLTTAQINVRVHNWSQGYFLGAEWKPSDDDSIGISYHSRVGNRLKGQYKIYFPNDAKLAAAGNITAAQLFDLIPLANQLNAGNPDVQIPALNANGADASAVLNLPAFANIDYLHKFSDRFSLAASLAWTNWSKFQSLTLVSMGQQMVSLPQNYRNSYTASLGGDYRLNEQWTLRGGVAYDETPTVTSARDPRVPDNNRRIVGLGIGYQASQHLSLDMAYSHQFLSDARLHQTGPFALGGASIDGSVQDSGNVASLTATYLF